MSGLNLSHKNILVFGDVMLDEYRYGDVARISPEAPIPVLRVTGEHLRPGGGANVALNVQSLGSQASLLGLIGNDKPGQQLQKMLAEQHIHSHLQFSDNCHTIVKTRVIGRNQQLLRIDLESLTAYRHAAKHDLQQHYQRLLADHDLVVLSDYAKGVLEDIPALIALAKQQQLPVLVDPKQDDFSDYRGATLVTPNWQEFIRVVGPCDERDIVSKATALCETYDIAAILVKRGSKGMVLVQPGEQALFIPAHVHQIYDVTGAGDTVIATMAVMLANGKSVAEAAQWANTAAGIVVTKLGAEVVTTEELNTAYSQQPTGCADNGILSLTQLVSAVKKEHLHGAKIVCTNGCFDLLHAGHIDFLQRAKALGDTLVVLVNDDASVRRLKGESRPINPLAARLSVLAALACVDYVAPFSEDTPAEAIAKIQPDILVKGNDYTCDQIAGGQSVQQRGGRVMTIPLLEGYSTTRLIDTIIQRHHTLQE